MGLVSLFVAPQGVERGDGVGDRGAAHGEVEAAVGVEADVVGHVERDVDDVGAAGLHGGVEPHRRGRIGEDVPLPLRFAALVAGPDRAVHRDDALRLLENVRVEQQGIADVRHRADGQERDLAGGGVQCFDDELGCRLFLGLQLVEAARPVELPVVRRLAELLVGLPVAQSDQGRLPADVDRDVVETGLPEHSQRQRRPVRGARVADGDTDECDLRAGQEQRHRVGVVDVRTDVAVEQDLLAFNVAADLGLAEHACRRAEQDRDPNH